MEKTYHLHCKQCGRAFTSKFPARKYCSESCRASGYEKAQKASNAAQNERRHRQRHEYTCRLCGRRLAVVGSGGRSARKYCDDCLAKRMGGYGRTLLSHRNDLPEIVIG